MDTAAFRRYALPKPPAPARRFTMPAFGTVERSVAESMLRQATPAERLALAAIVDNADLVDVDGAPAHLLVKVTPELLDALAAFDAEAEDMEPSEDDEADDHDEDDDPKEDDDAAEDEDGAATMYNPARNPADITIRERLRADLKRGHAVAPVHPVLGVYRRVR
jgi:hypothetical protein